MGCTTVCCASFALVTVLIIVALALPVWYEETWPDFHEQAYTSANLWTVCYKQPKSMMDDNVTETCKSTIEAYKDYDYFTPLTICIVLVGCGLGLSAFAFIAYCVWSCKRKRNLLSDFKMSRSGLTASVFAFSAGAVFVAANIVFNVNLDKTPGDGLKNLATAYWLHLAGALLQLIIALMTLIFIIISYREATKSPDIDVTMHSAIPTLQIVEEPNRFNSRA